MVYTVYAYNIWYFPCFQRMLHISVFGCGRLVLQPIIHATPILVKVCFFQFWYGNIFWSARCETFFEKAANHQNGLVTNLAKSGNQDRKS